MKTRFSLVAAVLLIIATLGVALAGDTGRWLFDWLKGHQVDAAIFADAEPVLAGTLYALLFVAVTALSLPLATVLTLFAGAVFGFVEALLLTILAGAIGATLAMLLSRYAFRAQVEKRWPRQVAVMDRGVARDGPWYLLSLRLAPMPPFFVVNAAMGLTRMPARDFFLVSLIGLAPLDAVFVNAGSALAKLEAPEDALNPGLGVALLLIGLMPLGMRYLRRAWLRRRGSPPKAGG